MSFQAASASFYYMHPLVTLYFFTIIAFSIKHLYAYFIADNAYLLATALNFLNIFVLVKH